MSTTVQIPILGENDWEMEAQRHKFISADDLMSQIEPRIRRSFSVEPGRALPVSSASFYEESEPSIPESPFDHLADRKNDAEKAETLIRHLKYNSKAQAARQVGSEHPHTAEKWSS